MPAASPIRKRPALTVIAAIVFVLIGAVTLLLGSWIDGVGALLVGAACWAIGREGKSPS